MFSSLLKNKNILTIILSLCILGILFVFSPFFHVLNKSIQNEYYALKNTYLGAKVSENIVIVTIDKKTVDALGRFPFSRDVYTPLLKNLKKYGTATLGFDILFIDETDTKIDQELSQSLREFTDIVLGSAITSEGEIETPKLFEKDVFSTGFLPPNVDSSNRTVYSFSPFLNFSGNTYEHFSIALLRNFYSYLYGKDFRNYTPKLSQNSYTFAPDIVFPLSSPGSNDILIHFVPKENFRTLSFIDVYNDTITDTSILQDSIVLVGTTIDGIKDEFYTPYGVEYGVYAHANILNTLLTKNFTLYFDKKLEWFLIFLLIIMGTYFNLGYSRLSIVVVNILLILFFIITIPLAIFFFTDLIMNYPSEIVFALVLSLTLSNGVKYAIEDQNKSRLKKSLSEYVGANIAEEVLENSGKINFDGEEKQAVLFFSDIEGFTTISEEMMAKELVAFLRDYLSQMSHIILDEKGYINKYEGDAIMALWGVFGEISEENYIQACRTSLKQLELLEKLNRQWKDYYGHEIHIRIGLHAGEVIVGNIGAKDRKMEFTALGDTVNLASRLEGVNKFYGTHICVSEDMYKKTKQYFSYRFLDRIRVKGKKKMLSIYELLGVENSLSEEKRKNLKKFSQAQELYFQREFEKAKEIFSDLAAIGDSPSLTFKARCTMYILEAPASDWDGVWNMDEK